MKQVLGTPIGTPPPGAEATALPPATADLNTNRKQVDAQTTGGVCETCHHGYINPAGFVDGGVQRRRHLADEGAVDRRGDRHRRPTSSSTAASVHVNNAFDLMQKIAASPMAQHRYAERLTSYLYEREGDPMDCGTVNDLAAKIAPGGYTVLNLITDLTQTPQFRTRAVGAMQ